MRQQTGFVQLIDNAYVIETSNRRRCSKEKIFLKILQNSQENICAKVSFLIQCCRNQACNFIKKETLAQVFSCEFCEIFKIIFFTKHLWTTVSAWHYCKLYNHHWTNKNLKNEKPRQQVHISILHYVCVYKYIKKI